MQSLLMPRIQRLSVRLSRRRTVDIFIRTALCVSDRGTPMSSSSEGAAMVSAPAVRSGPFTFASLWLAVIVLVGAGIRLLSLNAPLLLTEFPSLHAVAERAGRPGETPPSSEPLLPVTSCSTVRERSVLPYGIENPVPLYHYCLYLTIQYVPMTEWGLRFPSFIAGLCCIVGMYCVCRRGLGT